VKAVLLAAGLGTRLHPLTAERPKCMVSVGDRPVLQRNIEWLRDGGVTDLAVNLHYFPEVVRRHFGTGDGVGVSLHYSIEPVLLGTAGAVRNLRTWLDEDDFLVVYADNLIALDLAEFVRAHCQSRATATVALYWREEVQASGVAELTPSGRVATFIEKPKPGSTESHWINAGLLCCSPRMLRFIPDGFSDFGHDVLPALLQAGEPIGGYRMTAGESLHWIDTPEDLRNAQAAIGSQSATR